MNSREYENLLSVIVAKGRLEADECRRLNAEFDRAKRGSDFWSPWMITVAICTLCLGSYIVGVMVGMHQGAAVQQAIQQAEEQ
jgi:hypothetical protein